MDIWARDNDTAIAIELKYKTRGLNLAVNEETFNLLNQSAQDIARYDFLKDMQRLEFVAESNEIKAYAIFLTNDSAYWKKPLIRNSVDADFRIHQGRVLNGYLQWAKGASKGTTRGREKPIVLKGSYNLNWQHYSEPSSVSYGVFKFLLAEIKPKL